MICTPDKDLGQCVGGKVVQLDRRREIVLDADAVRAKFGVPPSAIADWLALVGDSADGFPGLPGWGAKTAAAVLSRYGQLEAIPDDARAWEVPGVRGAERLAATLATGREVANLFKVLATLRTDAEVGTVDEWLWTGPTAEFPAWCERFGSAGLARRVDKLAPAARRLERGGGRVSNAVVIEPVRPGIMQLTLNRPERLNAMNHALVAGLYDALDEVSADRSCRVILLTGSGRGFCAGLDLTDGASPPSAAGLGRAQAGMTVQKMIAGLVPKMRSIPQPIIAAVNGPASGGGLALALASDVRIAAASARFNVAFIRVGLSGCDIGVSWMLPRLIGASRAFELLLTGRLIDATEADRIGLVTRVVPDGAVVDAALETAELIVGNSPFGVRMTKEVMWSQLEIGSLQAGIDLENRTQVLSSFTGDLVEAMAAFSEKRPPAFRDE